MTAGVGRIQGQAGSGARRVEVPSGSSAGPGSMLVYQFDAAGAHLFQTGIIFKNISKYEERPSSPVVPSLEWLDTDPDPGPSPPRPWTLTTQTLDPHHPDPGSSPPRPWILPTQTLDRPHPDPGPSPPGPFPTHGSPDARRPADRDGFVDD